MKRAIKIGLFAVLIGCFLLTSVPVAPQVAASDCNSGAVVMYYAPWLYEPWYQQYGSYEPQTWQVLITFGALFQPQVRISYPAVSLYLQKYEYDPSAQVNIRIWHVENVGGEVYCPVDDEPLIDKTISTTGWATGEWQWVTAYDADAFFNADGYYAIVVRCLDGKHVRWAKSDWEWAFSFNGYTTGGTCDACEGETCGLSGNTGWDMGVKVQGCWAPPITVLTQDGYVSQDGNIVMGGLVTSLGVEGKVKCYIDYGFTEALGNEQYVKTVSSLTPPASYYNWQLGSWPQGSYIYFRARIVEPVSGEIAYGAIESVLYPEVIPQISCEVVVNDAWTLTFETVISSIDDVEAVDLVLYYGQNWTCFISSDNVTMFEDIDEAGVFRWDDVNWGIFEPGQTYYYYAEEQTTESVTIVRSETMQFKRYDPNKPKWRNWVENWLAGLWGTAELPPINGWWILAIVVFLIVFFLTTRAKNWRLGLAWGMVAMLVLLYVLVMNDLVNPWLVVLLSILAGYIVYKFLFAPVMHK